MPLFQPLHPLRGRALAESEVQAMSNEKLIFGGLWAGCRTRLGFMHQTRLYGTGEGELKAEVALQFHLF